MQPQLFQKGEFTISTDPARLQIDRIHHYLHHEAYWCKGIPREVLQHSIDHSLNFGLYHRDAQIGFARAITDFATFAYLADVFILGEFRGRGLSKWLIETIVNYSELQGLRRWMLATSDAHGLYEKYGGFSPVANPEIWMERRFPDVYKKSTPS